MSFNETSTDRPRRTITDRLGSDNGVTGETIVYAYDTLRRLITATSSGAAAWTQAFQHDGFGNLTSEVLNSGSNTIPSIDPATNRQLKPSINGADIECAGFSLDVIDGILERAEREMATR